MEFLSHLINDKIYIKMSLFLVAYYKYSRYYITNVRNQFFFFFWTIVDLLMKSINCQYISNIFLLYKRKKSFPCTKLCRLTIMLFLPMEWIQIHSMGMLELKLFPQIFHSVICFLSTLFSAKVRLYSTGIYWLCLI